MAEQDSISDIPATYYVGLSSIQGTPDPLVLDYRDRLGALFAQHEPEQDYCQTFTDVNPYGRRTTIHMRGKVLGKRHITICPVARTLQSVKDARGNRLDEITAMPSTTSKMDGLPPVIALQSTEPVGMVDASTAAMIGDPFLEDLLSARHAVGGMKPIYATIQAEQDKLIRSDAATLIVQGPAGSGKTIVALQRAAQLLFDDRRVRRQRMNERGLDDVELETASGHTMVVFSPNAIFSGYISGVLPGLNEDAIEQIVLEERLRRELSARLGLYTAPPEKTTPVTPRRRWQIEKRRERYETLSGTMPDTQPSREPHLKTSLALVKRLRQYVTQWADTLEKMSLDAVPDILLPAGFEGAEGESEGVFYNAQTFSRQFRDILNLGTSPTEAWESAVKQLRQRGHDFKRRYEGYATTSQIEAKINEAESILHGIAAPSLLTLDAHYRAFWEAQTVISDMEATENPQARVVAEQTCAMLRKGHIACEDIVPLLLLDGMLHGVTFTLPGVTHAIVDEAQDYTPLHFEYLRRILPQQCRFTIVGDVHQGIDPDLNIRDWSQLQPVFKDLKLHTLTRSYRSAREITDFAAAVLGPHAPLVESVRAAGTLPQVVVVPATESALSTAEADLADAVYQACVELQQAGQRTVGVLCHNRTSAQAMTRRLKKLQVSSSDTTQFSGEIRAVLEGTESFAEAQGIIVAPVYLAKGLEFDAVIIADAGRRNYSDELGRRALYTACTRPLHALILICPEGPSALLPQPDTGLYELKYLPVPESSKLPLRKKPVKALIQAEATEDTTRMKTTLFPKKQTIQQRRPQIALNSLSQDSIAAALRQAGDSRHGTIPDPVALPESVVQVPINVINLDDAGVADALLAPWRALPLNAPLWDDFDSYLDQFVASLRGIVAEKQHHAAYHHAFQALDAAITRLKAKQEEGLAEFGIALPALDMTSGTTVATPDELHTLAQSADALAAALEEYLSIDVRSVPLAERGKLRKRHAELEEFILHNGADLAAILEQGQTQTA